MRSVFSKLRGSVAGDTIVEVMISMAVLGATLGISYAIANNSLNQSRDAQERTQVVKILQGQLELLRASAGLSNTQVYTASGQYCFYTDSTGNTSMVPWPNPSTPPANGHCTQGFYNYYITRDTTSDTFTATAYWDNAMGTSSTHNPTGRLTGDTAQLVYRLHPAS